MDAASSEHSSSSPVRSCGASSRYDFSSSSPSSHANTIVHPMLTRAKVEIFKPKKTTYVTRHPIQPSAEPTTISQALPIPHWRANIDTELLALAANHT